MGFVYQAVGNKMRLCRNEMRIILTTVKNSLFNDARPKDFQPFTLIFNLQFPRGMGKGKGNVIHPSVFRV